jgi:hypothetical protein
MQHDRLLAGLRLKCGGLPLLAHGTIYNAGCSRCWLSAMAEEKIKFPVTFFGQPPVGMQRTLREPTAPQNRLFERDPKGANDSDPDSPALGSHESGLNSQIEYRAGEWQWFKVLASKQILGFCMGVQKHFNFTHHAQSQDRNPGSHKVVRSNHFIVISRRAIRVEALPAGYFT